MYKGLAPCSRWGIYKGAFPLVRTTGVCCPHLLPWSKSLPRAFFNSLLVSHPRRPQRPRKIVHAAAHQLPFVVEPEPEGGDLLAFIREHDLGGQQLLGGLVHRAFCADDDRDGDLGIRVVTV